jgi:flagellar biosynthesis/type III secretory pathway M-ring protein FliF/YscJ
MEAFKSAAEYVRRLWGNLGPSQRLLVGAAAVAALLLAVWATVSATDPPSVRVVGREAAPEERAAVLRKFQKEGRPHEVRDQEIYVPRRDADRVILELAGDGILSDQALWKFLEEDAIFADRWQKEKRYQVALQRRLEYMIRKVDAVRNASVQISPGSEAWQTGFQGPRPSASVQVELHPGKALHEKNVLAIAGLVAHAVPGLDRDRVHIMDTQGRAYKVPRSETAASIDDLRGHEARLEEEIKAKIIDLFPTARVVVRAVAKTANVHVREKKYGRAVPVREEEHKGIVKGALGTGEGGFKGKGELGPPPEPAAPDGGRSLRVENVVDETVTERSEPLGAIESVTVGVLIPVEEGRSFMTPDQAKDLIAKAVGRQAEPDAVSVLFVPTRRPEPLPPPAFSDRAAEWLEEHGQTVVLFVLAVAALAVLARLLRTARPRAGAAGPVPAPGALSAGAAGPEEGELGRIRQGIRELVGRRPAQAAAALRQWLAGK